jgi:Lhr-like helicase
MSRNYSAKSATKTVVTAKKPCCKVCLDAGKSESEYSSHWVKDFSGKITCPTLLNTKCRFCHNLGHTTKFCAELEKVNKGKEKSERRSQMQISDVVNQKQQKNMPGKPENTFASLCDSDSDEDEKYQVLKAQKKKIEFALPKVKPDSEPEVKKLTGWAAIAAKPKEEKPVVEPGMVLLSDFIKKPKQTAAPKQAPKQAPWAKGPVLTKTWANWSDSEDEDVEVEDDTW